MNMIKKLFWSGVTVAAPVVAMADAPIDLTATGVAIAGYIAAAAAAALGIFAGLYGLRVIVRAFRSLK